MSSTDREGSAEQDTTVHHSGRSSMKLSPSESNHGPQPLAVTQNIGVRGLAQRSVRYAGYIRVQGGATAHIGLLTLVQQKPEHLVMLTQSTTDDWVQLEGNYDVPTSRDAKVVFICWVDGQTGAAWFDDLSLRADGGGASGSAATPKADAHLPTTARIQIDASRVVRQIPSSLYGANLEWIWNGNGLWQADQNMPDAKIVALTKGMGIKLLRFPGGVYSDFYHWKAAVGPSPSRAEMEHLPGKDERSRPLFGTDEALRFAHDTGAELLITVNAGTGTAREAADWVRYVNKPNRQVRFWEIGNELYLNDRELGPRAVTLPPEQYAKRFIEFSQAMRAVDPEIKILAIGGRNHGRYQTNAYSDWDAIVLARAQDQIDYLSVHNAYAPLLKTDTQDLPTVYRAMLASPTLIAENLEAVRKEIETYAPHRAAKIGIAITEWGPAFRFDFSTRFIDHGKTLASALFAASAFQVLLSSKTTDIANFWQLNDFSVLGWIGTRNTTFPPRPEWIATARSRAFSMFSRYFGPTLVQCSVSSSSFASEAVGLTDAVPDAPDIMSVASLGSDRRHLYVIAINRSLDHDVQTTISIAGFRPIPLAEVHTLNGSSIDANTGTGIVAVPGLKIPAQATAGATGRFNQGGESELWQTDTTIQGGSKMILKLPAHSITALVLDRTGE